MQNTNLHTDLISGDPLAWPTVQRLINKCDRADDSLKNQAFQSPSPTTSMSNCVDVEMQSASALPVAPNFPGSSVAYPQQPPGLKPATDHNAEDNAFSASPIRPHPGSVGSLEREIVLSLCGQVITYNLATLEDDPKTVIGLLKLTSSERGNWMMVSAYYRRKGNPAAALAVVTAMVEVLNEHGVREGDLKPAFLMLSGCETDLGKMTRAADGSPTEVSNNHYRRSQQWLQRVYGRVTPAPTINLDLTADQALCRAIRASTNITNMPSSPQSQPPLLSTSTTPDLSASSLDRIHTLQREVQYLRDHQRHQNFLLNRTSAAKCKLEDDLARVHMARRRLQRQLDSLQEQLDSAQKSESLAKEQLQQEVNLRKRAEEIQTWKGRGGENWRRIL